MRPRAEKSVVEEFVGELEHLGATVATAFDASAGLSCRCS
jgi:hypothetical protein